MSEQSQGTTSQDNAVDSSRSVSTFIAKVGRRTRTGLAVLMPTWMALVFGSMTLIMGIIAGLAFGGGDNVQPQVAAPTAANNTAVAPAPAPEPAWTSPIKQVAGVTYDGRESYGLTYQCESGLAPVQLSPGQTVQTDGTTFSLTESKKSWDGSQGVLTLSVKLNVNTAVRGIVVTPAAHVKHPHLYNEYDIAADFGYGTAATQEFQPDTYSQNYERLGINTLTLCTEKK